MLKVSAIVFLLSLSLQANAASVGFAEEKALAQAMLFKAYNKSSTPELFKKMIIHLSQAELVFKIDEDNRFEECETKADLLAFVNTKDYQRIFICPRLTLEKSDLIVQVIIHETAHLIGYHDECQATIFEFGAFALADLSLAHDSYAKQCGLSTF